MRIALVQMHIASGDKERNILHGMDLLDRAAKEADLVALPEMWTVGYDFHHLEEQATHPGDELMERLSALARYNGVTLAAGSIPFAFPDGIYNTSFVFGPDGRVKAVYRKVHLFSGFVEARVMKAGTEYVCAHASGVDVGLSICYELRFPEMFRALAGEGATLILMAASWPAERLSHWRILSEARAIENEVFFAAVNGVGSYKGIRLGGHSLFITPDGTVAAEGGDEEALLFGEYDHDAVLRQRKALAVWNDIKENIPLRK